MAKDKEGSDGYEFVPPDFNEDEFIHKEMVAFKTTSILFVWAIIAAAVSWGVFLYFKGNDKAAWPAGLGICLAFGLALKPIFSRFADISHFKRGNWVGSGILFFFCWLAFFTVAVNPPISDVSPPQVMVSADPPVQAAGGDVRITFLAADNAGTPDHTLRLLRDGVELPAIPVSADTNNPGRYTALLSNPTTQPGRYTLELSATDGRGHKASTTANFTIQAGALLNVQPANGEISGTTQVLVQVDALPCSESRGPPCLRTVYFTSGPSSPAVPFEFDEGLDAWKATAKFAGWKDGENSGQIRAEFIDHFSGPVRITGGVLTSLNHTYTVRPPAERYEVEVIPQPGAQPIPVPGYGLMGTLVALLAVAFVVRARSDRTPGR